MSSKPKWWFIVALLLLSLTLLGQPQSQQQLPDAPSAKPLPNKPAPPAPVPPQDAGPPLDSGTAPSSSQPSSPAQPSSGTPVPNPITGETPGPTPVEPKPMPPISRAQPGATAANDPREQLFTFSTNVDFVTVPVSVKDSSGHMVPGLVSDDFTVYENGTRQNLKYFTSDPFPLSAAIVLDVGLPEQVLNKVRVTLDALTGAFSPFDELSVFTYGTTVKRVSDFTAINDQLDAALKKVKAQRGRNPGVPTVQGPMISGPSVNGMPVDPGSPHTPTVMHESNVLNDAVLAAALELAKRDQAPHWRQYKVKPRKILFLISDGREDGSRTSYADVLKVLLSNEITVYAIGVGNAATPVYNKIQKFRIPGTNSSDYLPKYASATGGQVFNEFGQEAIESAYARVTSEARNQYTLGYTTAAKGAGAYRSIEVRVKRDNVKVYARDGYYPAPPIAHRSTPDEIPRQ
jgi:VWFA-related protein